MNGEHDPVNSWKICSREESLPVENVERVETVIVSFDTCVEGLRTVLRRFAIRAVIAKRLPS